LFLIEEWGIRFESEKDILPLYNEIYTALKKKGLAFPKKEVHVQPK